MLLDQITPDSLSLSLFLIILNIPVFLFGLSRQGVTFTVYSIFTVAVYSLMSFLIMNVFPIDVSFISPLAGSDLLLCAIFGGVISGIGSGLTIRFGGAIDGIDVFVGCICKKDRTVNRFVCPDLQHFAVHCLRNYDEKLDTAALFDRDVLHRFKNDRLCC